jgi:hypothetical protein
MGHNDRDYHDWILAPLILIAQKMMLLAATTKLLMKNIFPAVAKNYPKLCIYTVDRNVFDGGRLF